MAARSLNRFSSPTMLTDSTLVLGATAKQWDMALTGNLEKTLLDVKRRVAEVATLGGIVDDACVPESNDLATAVKGLRKNR